MPLTMKILRFQSRIVYSHFFQFWLAIVVTTMVLLINTLSVAQTPTEVASIALKKLSIEDLMNVEVTSVSKRPEKLTEVPSAIQVISHEDIHRSGATTLPDALRLATNLQVAQLNSHAWIISARGFNGVFSNKLLVMIDGRTVYSPLFAGVFWDAQSILLEDVDRIEVISGPGGALWGVNAVNGVINIITKSPTDTKGLYASQAMGTFLNRHGSMRYGGNLGQKVSYRIFAQFNERDNTFENDSNDVATSDRWNYTQTGFALNWEASEKDGVAVQGNVYSGTERTKPSKSTFDGQNLLARWKHIFSEESELTFQAYYDRAWRQDIPSTISDELDTYDLELQHRFSFLKNHTVIWGFGYRLMKDKSQHSTDFVGFLPGNKTMPLFSAFIQDEIQVSNFKFILGSKVQHNVYSDFELLPNFRVAWTPQTFQTVWGAISRAVRAPSRIDVDYFLPTYQVGPGIPNVAGGPNFVSEKLISYELGYRVQPRSSLLVSVAAFYNEYDDVYTVEALSDGVTYQIQNGAHGNSKGLEFCGVYQISQKHKLRGGYTYFKKDLKNKTGHNFHPAQLADLGRDAQDQLFLQSINNLPGHFNIDLHMRYVSKIPGFIPDYFTFDTRVAWLFKQLELSVVGQNLWEKRHREYRAYLPRSVYVQMTCRF
jgi:iron complex outermembrane receptor protein